MDFVARFKELIELRRAAADAEEKEIIDKAINKLIDSMPCGGTITFPSSPAPWYVSKPEPVPYLNNPIMCCVQKGN